MRGGGVHEGEDSPSPVSPGMVVAEGYRVLEGKAGMILERFCPIVWIFLENYFKILRYVSFTLTCGNFVWRVRKWRVYDERTILRVYCK